LFHKILNTSVEISWLKALSEAWIGAAEHGRPAHAVLLEGVPGVGKRAAAAWLARQRLGIGPRTALPLFPATVPEHPDLYWLRPPDGKQAIGIEQIRGLVADLGLTSYEGAAKVAVIEPANAMTSSAANSLLKTLEEPPGDALLVLVADRLRGLPATILSRCQRLAIATPPESASLAWLERLQPGTNWSAALHEAGNAPLAAIAARDRLDVTNAMVRDFAGVADRRLSPIDVAARWTKYEPEFVLGWLARQVQQCIRRMSGSSGRPGVDMVAESVLNRIDRRNLFCYLDSINRLRGQTVGSFNVQLAVESLLIDWAEGLQNCGHRFIRGGLLPIPEGKVNA
jgi:DNA polymerase III subunit delta'